MREAKRGEFVYIGDVVPEINEKEEAEFFLNLRRELLFALERRGALTSRQRERCLEELEKRYAGKRKK